MTDQSHPATSNSVSAVEKPLQISAVAYLMRIFALVSEMDSKRHNTIEET
ncbi:hypothetical protein RchiOBHm_Chr4g0389811 [Rosa chinensis]|uniref:Uncharacterized protein n=1 Tax=Rosa chinensis TaxID=74649 RepID=A0A2P6QQ40_ROSCH|nr:hypothetical protein RchiOBHm_Chr4g0389811 [Rosa chinensis]